MNQERKNLLAQLKTNDLKANVPSVSEENAAFLHNLILERGCQSALEIGTAHGYSTIWLADALEQNDGHLTTIEHSPPSFNQAKVNIYRAKLEQSISQHLGRAQTVIAEILTADQSYDFIFIDGIKKSTLEFFDLASPKLKKGGIIVIDDVIKFKVKMKNFYDYLEDQSDWKFNVIKLDEDDGILVIERA